MSRFRITEVNPLAHKEDIQSLWKECLPDTPPGRFDWMMNNPDGMPIWYLAFDIKNQLAGSVSIMPRRVVVGTASFNAGIAGDLMVRKQYQVFGPAIDLLKTLIARRDDHKLHIIYTFPNKAAEKLTLRAGFEVKAVTKRYVKILRFKQHLIQRFHFPLVSILASFLDFVHALSFRETYLTRSLHSEIDGFELNHVADAAHIKLKHESMVQGLRTSEYLRWRYEGNPLCSFRTWYCSRVRGEQPVGWIIYSSNNGKIVVFDIIFTDSSLLLNILAVFLRDMRMEGVQSVSIRSIEQSPMSEMLDRLGFVDRGGAVPLLTAGSDILKSKDWYFLDGDRNV